METECQGAENQFLASHVGTFPIGDTECATRIAGGEETSKSTLASLEELLWSLFDWK